jgi:hypothetical protein
MLTSKGYPRILPVAAVDGKKLSRFQTRQGMLFLTTRDTESPEKHRRQRHRLLRI